MTLVGWQVTDALPNLEWWADEMWRIESSWSPVGTVAYLTFLVDPQADVESRQKGENVWAVMVSRSRPNERLHKESLTFSFGSGWEKRLIKITNYLSQLRDTDHAFG